MNIYIYTFSRFNASGNFNFDANEVQFSVLESEMNYIESVMAEF